MNLETLLKKGTILDKKMGRPYLVGNSKNIIFKDDCHVYAKKGAKFVHMRQHLAHNRKVYAVFIINEIIKIVNFYHGRNSVMVLKPHQETKNQMNFKKTLEMFNKIRVYSYYISGPLAAIFLSKHKACGGVKDLKISKTIVEIPGEKKAFGHRISIFMHENIINENIVV